MMSKNLVSQEDNEKMTGSYVMIDPAGRFFQNTQGIYKYSSPIQEVGVLEALKQVGFNWKKLVDRGGSEYFENEVSYRVTLENLDAESVEGL